MCPPVSLTLHNNSVPVKRRYDRLTQYVTAKGGMTD